MGKGCTNWCPQPAEVRSPPWPLCSLHPPTPSPPKWCVDEAGAAGVCACMVWDGGMGAEIGDLFGREMLAKPRDQPQQGEVGQEGLCVPPGARHAALGGAAVCALPLPPHPGCCRPRDLGGEGQGRAVSPCCRVSSHGQIRKVLL